MDFQWNSCSMASSSVTCLRKATSVSKDCLITYVLPFYALCYSRRHIVVPAWCQAKHWQCPCNGHTPLRIMNMPIHLHSSSLICEHLVCFRVCHHRAYMGHILELSLFLYSWIGSWGTDSQKLRDWGSNAKYLREQEFHLRLEGQGKYNSENLWRLFLSCC